MDAMRLAALEETANNEIILARESLELVAEVRRLQKVVQNIRQFAATVDDRSPALDVVFNMTTDVRPEPSR